MTQVTFPLNETLDKLACRQIHLGLATADSAHQLQIQRTVLRGRQWGNQMLQLFRFRPTGQVTAVYHNEF